MKISVLLVLLLIGCSGNPVTPCVEPLPFGEAERNTCPPDAGADSGDGPVVYSCGTACAKLAALGCDAAKPSPKGRTCEEICLNASSGDAPPGERWRTSCLSVISSCADIERCF